MYQKKILFALFCFSLLFFIGQPFAQAPPDADLRAQVLELQKQMLEMRKEYSANLERLQAEIENLKNRSLPGSTPPAADTSSAERERLLQPSGAVTKKTSQLEDEDLLDNFVRTHVAKVLPDKVADSLSLDASVVIDAYYHRDNARKGISHTKEEIAGFGHHHHHGHGHSHGSIENGFNLRHIELGLSAVVDPYFTAWTTLAFEHEEGVEVEEAVIQSTSLPWGLTLSAGRFMSGIGRLNRQHSHNWDFIETPLVYEKLFGGHGVTEKGLQLTWLAPAPFYLLLGAELANGENENLSNSIGGEYLHDHDAPRLWSTFMKISPSLGQRHDLQIGLSYLRARHQEEHDEDHDQLSDLWMDGYNQVYGADFVYKYNAQRSHGQGDFTVQAEYFHRKKRLRVENSLLASELIGHHKSDWQDGYYVQAAYGIMPRWRLGLRWEQVGLRNKSAMPDGGEEEFGTSWRSSAMLEWKLSEFSLLRLQGGRGNYQTDEGRQKAWELGLQIQVSIGEHKAHDF